MQAWHVRDHGFISFFTRYDFPADRTICCMTSSDGIVWEQWQRLAAIDKGHYQISAAGRKRAGAAFNYHPEGKGLNWRSNLYFCDHDGKVFRLPRKMQEDRAKPTPLGGG